MKYTIKTEETKEKQNEKPVFHIYKIGSDTASFEHTISMLKRELESIESKKE